MSMWMYRDESIIGKHIEALVYLTIVLFKISFKPL